MLERIREVTDDIDVGLLIYNAGASHTTAPFLDNPLEEALKVVRLNVIGHVSLSHHFGKKMQARRRGGIAIIGALASAAGAAYVAAYSGSKGFAQMLSEALWFEFRNYGVDVVYVPLGSTDTPAMARLGITFAHRGAASAEDMAQEIIDNIGSGPVYVPRHLVEVFGSYYKMSRREATEAMSSVIKANVVLPENSSA